jgi:hypothetical protein
LRNWKKEMNKKYIYAAALALLACGSAQAVESIVGKVKTLEASYMPTFITFTLDTGSTVCPANKWLVWKNVDKDNNKAVYASLLAAMTTGKSVRFHYADGDTNCNGTYIHFFDF